MSGYLFIPVLEVVLCAIKSKVNIKGLNIFNRDFLYTVEVDETTFFLKDKNSVFKILNIFHKFSLVFRAKPNTTKCEIVGMGALK